MFTVQPAPRARRLGIAIAWPALVAVLGVAATASASLSIQFNQISTNFNTPIGIAYHEPTNSVIISANYPSGQPLNFERILFDGTHVPFSSVSGLTDEVYLATVRSGNPGGFTTGEVYTGTGVDGQVMRLSPDGSTVTNPWVTFPGSGHGLLRGALHVDNTGVWGGNLLAATNTGEIWQITSAGVPTQIANLGTIVEGLAVLPNDPARWGPYAGSIVTGSEANGNVYFISPTGAITTYALGGQPENVNLIEANANFFGVDYGAGRILRADQSYFTGLAGDLAVGVESTGGTSGLYHLYYDGSSIQSEIFNVTTGPVPVQWEGATFAPTEIPEPAALGLLALGGLLLTQRRR